MNDVTISTHNLPSFAYEHNRRNPKVIGKEDHIDPTRPHENQIEENPRKAYDRIFGEYVKAYNEKQTRQDRQIKDYYNTVAQDKKRNPVYEMIIGVYGRNENGVSICDEATGKKIMREFVDEWPKRNPNLELIGAYYHADEQGEPHVHIDYIPVAHNYTRGLEVQNGLVKAFGEMGFVKEGKRTAQIQQEARENAALEKICNKHELTVTHPREEGRKHLETEQFQKEQLLQSTVKNTADLLNEQAKLKQEIAELKRQRDRANDQAIKAVKRKERALERSFKRQRDEYGTTYYTYDKGLLEEIREINEDLKQSADTLASITHTNTDIEIQQKEARQANKDAQYLKKELERRITEKDVYLQKVADINQKEFEEDFRQQMYPDGISDYTKRLVAFCQKVKFKDGTPIFETFRQEEQQRASKTISRYTGR